MLAATTIDYMAFLIYTEAIYKFDVQYTVYSKTSEEENFHI